MKRFVARNTVVLALLGALALPATALAQAPGKVDVCHKTGTKVFIHLTIAEDALDKHLEHGDGEVGQPVPGESDMLFAEDCSPEPAPAPEPPSLAREGCFETYGGGLFIRTNGQNPQLVNGEIPLYDDGTCLHVSSVARGVIALVWAVDAKEAAGQCADLGSQAPNQQREPHLFACL